MSLILLFLFVSCVIATENYAIRGEDDCYLLQFDTLRHNDAFQDIPSQQFLSSFISYLSLELNHNLQDAFKGYSSLSPPPSKTLLSEASKAMFSGCDCMMKLAGIKKQKKGPRVDPVCRAPYAFYYLGEYCKQHQQLDDALALFGAAGVINPSMAEPHTQAGLILLDKGNTLESLSSFKHATELSPKKYFTHYYYGIAFTHLNRMDEAQESFENALAVCSSSSEKFNVLLAFSTHLHKAGRKYWRKAEAVHKRTLEAAKMDSPRSLTIAQSHYGVFLKDQGKFNESIEYFNSAILGDPSDCGYRTNLGHTYEARHLPGDTEKALEQYESEACTSQMKAICEAYIVRQKLCAWEKGGKNWTNYIHTISEAVRGSHPLCVTPAMSVFSELSEPSLELVIAQNFAQRAEKNVKQKFKHLRKDVGDGVIELLEKLHSRTNLESKKIDTKARIKIGYVSAYFYDHIVGYILEHLLKLHDTSIYEIFIYVLNPAKDTDKTRKNLEEQIEHFVDVSAMHYSEVAAKIKEDNILVLVNLDGHMPGFPQEILAYLPAPVQVSFLGFPGSSGSNYTHYIVADKIIIPPTPEFQQLYSEKIIYMPHSYLPTQQATIHSNLTLKSSSDRPGTFTFCSLNQLIKLDPTTMKLWGRILSRVPNSQLWLQKHPPDAVPYLQEYLPNSNIVFLDRNSSVTEYMEQMKGCDLFLDPLKYNSHTTGADCLWMGVPLLTMPGTRFASRVGASLIHALECTPGHNSLDLVDVLVATDITDYEDTAVRLATNITLWTTVQETLSNCVRNSPLFVLKAWVQDWERGLIEAAYTKVVEKRTPEHISLAVNKPRTT